MSGTDNYLSRRDGRLYYRKVGQGEPLVLLHLLTSSGWCWRKVIDDFALHFTCLNIDFPGFDHSDLPGRRYQFEDFTNAVLDVMDHEKIPRADVVGAHFGADVALDLAASHPERVKKLVLDGLPYWNRERGKIVWEKAILPGFTDTTSFDIPVPPLGSLDEALKRDPNLDRREWQERFEIQQRTNRRWVALSYEALTGYESESVAPRVKAPTLLVYGEGDGMRRGGQRAAEGIGGSVLKVIAGAQGIAHEAAPQEFARLALDFLLG